MDLDGRRAYSCLMRGGLEALSPDDLRNLRLRIKSREGLLDAVRLWPCVGDVVQFRGLTHKQWRRVLGVTAVRHDRLTVWAILEGLSVSVTFLASDEPTWKDEDVRTVLLTTWRATWRTKDPVAVERSLERAYTSRGWLPLELLRDSREVARAVGFGVDTSGHLSAACHARSLVEAVASG